MHLLVQPGVSNLLLGSRELHDQGLVSRVLTSAPVTTAGSRFWEDARPESDRAIARYGARILEILERPLPLERDKPNELAPRTLRLASRARRRLIAFMDHVERQLAPNGQLAAIRAFANKVPEHAARLGGVLALVENSMPMRSRAITSRPASCSRSTTPPRPAACMRPGKPTPSSIWRSGCSTGSPGSGLAAR